MRKKSISSRFLYFYNRFRFSNLYDVVVIGAGNGGCEAAYAAARTGAKTVLITSNQNSIGQLIHNPSLGGIRKGQLIRQIDALGGLIGKISDLSAIQFKTLNHSKGQAVHGIRQLIDKEVYKATMLKQLQQAQNLTIKQMNIEDFEIDDKTKQIKSIFSKDGDNILGKTFLLTTGNFLRSRIHIGNKSYNSLQNIKDSSIAQPTAIGLVETLRRLKFPISTIITEISPIIDSKTIDYSQTEVQQFDNIIQLYSFFHEWSNFKPKQQLKWNRIYTNSQTHKFIKNNISQSYFSNFIQRKDFGTFYKTIQSKILKYPNQQSHLVWLEPQGKNSQLIYLNGLSNSFPQQIQLRILKTIPALRNVNIIHPGYARQYDCIDPANLDYTLKSKILDNLFLAGQINGTNGYQQAAAQGIIAGINAGLSAQNRSQYRIDSSKSYIGLLIESLIQQGNRQSRSLNYPQYRSLLRPSNADMRLTGEAIRLGIIKKQQQRSFIEKMNCINKAFQLLDVHHYSLMQWCKKLPNRNIKKRSSDKTARQIISNYDIKTKDLYWIKGIDDRVCNYIDSQLKYKNIIGKILREIENYKEEQYQQQVIDIKFENFKDKFTPKEYQIIIADPPKTMNAISNLSGIKQQTVLYLKYLFNKQSLSNHFKLHYQYKQSQTQTQN